MSSGVPTRRPAFLAGFLDAAGTQAVGVWHALAHLAADYVFQVGAVFTLLFRIVSRAPLALRNPSLTFQQLIRIGII
jgi:hypothetical protein